VGKIFLNGMASSYDATFPRSLDGLVDQQKYENYMGYLNNKVS
jgi:hypothetical protein